MDKDKLYVDSKGKIINIEPPKYGEVKLIIQNGRVVRSEITTSEQYK
ncbi:DUF2292 domain-containing protein [Vagococcus xieshaowenii]|uniref:DUF2292 domain-containing protein n=1 Tax=Vagococcus xieshaowenii TaxID=2562451 RepID=A0AAJ5JM87_9ENTE|nr:DUF2292 domain-containing protein [Vagococcus xieshaowenii]QCA29162.1 DUF2292 domain-containing protein [Vagococcus xieshaowenii]TFZ40860.1 DUF2292 domain-containing protein [Vagococcus xieshaowenii]